LFFLIFDRFLFEDFMTSQFNAAFDLAKTAVPKWQESLGWNESYSRRIRLITGLLGLTLLFAGIVMQWYDSLHKIARYDQNV
jgi:hypothetical protein